MGFPAFHPKTSVDTKLRCSPDQMEQPKAMSGTMLTAVKVTVFPLVS